MRLYRIGLLLPALLACAPAFAQQALDRIDPARLERERERAPATQSPAKVAPPLELERPRSGTADLGAPIQVGAVMISGLSALAPADFADIIARYIGQTVSRNELAILAGEVAARARGRGYVFASASIPQQRLASGVLTVRIDEGTIDVVRIEGEDVPAARAALTPLIGRPARLDDVERSLLIAGDLDGFDVRRSRFVREGDTGVLIVHVARAEPRIRAVLDNDSSSPIGPEQLRVDVDLNSLLFDDDAFTVTYLTTPLEPEELQYTRARYAKRLDASGTELSLVGSASRTRPGSYVRRLAIEGMSWNLGATLRQPLIRSRAQSLWLSAGMDVRNTLQKRRGIRFREDRLAVARVALFGNGAFAGGRLRANLTLNQGFDIFDATRRSDPLRSRTDADGSFTALTSSADWIVPLSGKFSIRLQGQAQVSSDPLLLAEEIGLGGAGYLRGYDYSERSGDNGAMGSAELRYHWKNPLGLGRKAQLYTFVDGGRVIELGRDRNGGALASGGGGVRADISPTIDANVEIAFPLTGPRFETGNRAPQLHFRLLKLF
jgi:hemolysin activation/secretion protein